MARALQPTLRPVAAIALLVMLLAIGTAWGFQLVGGFLPCELCLQQRVPYYLGIPLVLVGLAVVRLVPMGGRLLLFAAGLAMLWAAGLGIYHAGVEWALWEGPNTCGTATGSIADTTTLLSDLQQKVFVGCTSASGRFLGLSFAGWNVIAATAAALILFGSLALPARAGASA